MAELNSPTSVIYTLDNLPVLRGLNSECIDLIYLDPPYRLQLDGVPFAHAILARLSGSTLVAPSGHVLIQHFADLELPVAVRALALRVRKNYGGTSLSVYRRVVRGE